MRKSKEPSFGNKCWRGWETKWISISTKFISRIMSTIFQSDKIVNMQSIKSASLEDHVPEKPQPSSMWNNTLTSWDLEFLPFRKFRPWWSWPEEWFWCQSSMPEKEWNSSLCLSDSRCTCKTTLPNWRIWVNSLQSFFATEELWIQKPTLPKTNISLFWTRKDGAKWSWEIEDMTEFAFYRQLLMELRSIKPLKIMWLDLKELSWPELWIRRLWKLGLVILIWVLFPIWKGKLSRINSIGLLRLLKKLLEFRFLRLTMPRFWSQNVNNFVI